MIIQKQCKTLVKTDHIFLDRIDIQVDIAAVPFSDLSRMEPGESSATIRERVIAARKIQEQRFNSLPMGETCPKDSSARVATSRSGGDMRVQITGQGGAVHCNAQMTDKMLRQFCALDEQTNQMLEAAMQRLNLSARAYSRILKVARTIADLDNSENIQMHHVAEAVGYRSLDRGDWAER